MPAGIVTQFGHVIRKRRMMTGLSQESLAEKAGLHPTYISVVERGIKRLTLESAENIARALDTSLSQLIKEAETIRPAREVRKKG